MRLWAIDRLSWRLALSVALLVVVGQAASFFLVYRYAYRELLRTAEEHARTETWLIQQALEHGMLEKDDKLLRGMVSGLARDLSFERVMVLNRSGQVRFTSDPAIGKRHFSFGSPTCRVCHQTGPAERDRSTVIKINGGNVLRCVQPVTNDPACHGCHDPAHRINGLIIADVSLESTIRELERSASYLALGTSLIGLVLLGGIGLVFRRLVMRRLFRFEDAARALGRGDLERRVQVEGDDALARVEEQFNQMADALAGLLGELQQQRANLERVMNSVDDGMVVLDRERRIVAANDAFLRRFPQAGRGTLTGSCCTSLTEGLECCQPGECPTLRTFADGAVESVIWTRVQPDGTNRLEEVLTSPVVGPDGAISHVVEVWRDITDRRSAEARLAEHDRMVSLGRLASGFSHEVNTPLASIGTCLDGIARLSQEGEPGAGRDQIAEYARIAATQVQRCGAITEQFLQLARGRSLSRDLVDLPRVAEMTVRLCKQLAQEAGVAVEIEEPPASAVGAGALPTVVANAAAVQQVVLNLVINAVEASDAGQTVRISFAAGKAVSLRVHDEGRGIAREDLGRIFEPFFTRKESGTGLGLFVCLNLARGWGGDIIVDSTAGSGTTFSVLFPRSQSGDEPSDEQAQDSDRR